MASAPAFDRLVNAYQKALSALLAERNPEGYWTGELSASALSTATAVCALSLMQEKTQPAGIGEELVQPAIAKEQHRELINPDIPTPIRFDRELISRGLAWLAAHQNADGGWGDTVKSLSNISTTMLCRAAFHLAAPPLSPSPIEGEGKWSECLSRAQNYLEKRHGKNPSEQAKAVRTRYGKDRTFAVPILATCALAGLVEWKEVAPLPFELACLPQDWFRLLRLPVVSYALPALIAVGQLVYYHRPTWNPLAWLVRRLALDKSLQVLEAIQPESGGFLEAVPLTSFVTLSLAGIGLPDHPVARQGVQFLVNSARPDGSWPIDSNLSVWVTTLAINALAAAGELTKLEKRDRLRSWLIRQQFRSRHPYTGAKSGGWGWTDLPGSVPDADDTAGALLALSRLIDLVEDEAPNPSPRAIIRCNLADRGIDAESLATLPRLADLSWESRPVIQEGLSWLLGLQNRDGGWPTFCRGWGHLPFDRSGADLTAHALRALAAWKKQSEADAFYDQADRGYLHFAGFPLASVEKDLIRGLDYLANQQRPDGCWLPLWFGNQHAAEDENPSYGTARVLAAYRDLDMMDEEPARQGIAWLLKAQNADGGWGGGPGTPSSIEETALAIEILLDFSEAESAVNNGLAWLVQQVETGLEPSPIGFYFAKLWYFEKLYPIIFTVAALGRAIARRKDTP
jgi:squalene-hopene/tetraprenyl-beta-curcumene cyclase